MQDRKSTSAPAAQLKRRSRKSAAISRHRGRAKAASSSSRPPTVPKRRAGVSVQKAGRVTRASAAVMPTSKAAGSRQRNVAPRWRRHRRFCSNSASSMSGSGGRASSSSFGMGRDLAAISFRKKDLQAARRARRRAALLALRAASSSCSISICRWADSSSMTADTVRSITSSRDTSRSFGSSGSEAASAVSSPAGAGSSAVSGSGAGSAGGGAGTGSGSSAAGGDASGSGLSARLGALGLVAPVPNSAKMSSRS